ncbi:MAG: class I SAM-dependent methyltransferase [Candidatus Gracilibacteria bacterium]
MNIENNENHIILWNKYYIKNKISISWGYKEIDSHIVDFLNFYTFENGNNILDVGCGYGKNAIYLLSNNFIYYGIDIANEPISYAKSNYPKGNFYLKDILTLETNFIFDTIIDAGCLHVNKPENWNKILNKYNRLLEKGGRVFIRIFKSDNGSNNPLFIIDGVLPVRGNTKEKLTQIIEKHFYIDKIIFDKDYYKEDEIFYFYLIKK